MNTTKKAFLITILVAGSIFACEERPNDLQNPSAEHKTTFGAVQMVHNLAAQVAQDAAKQNETWVQLGAKEWPGSYPSWGQTKQGLYLSKGSYPLHLHSPWGEVSVYGGGSFRNSHSALTLFDQFRKNMRLKFVRNVCEKGSMSYRPEEIKFYAGDFQTPISHEELEKYRGSDTDILANKCGCNSIYEIESVQGIKLPKAERLEGNYRSSDDVKKSWDELMKRRVETLDQESR